MGKVIARTWLPTLLFVFAMGAIAAKTLGGVWTPIVAASAFIFTPIVWWRALGGEAYVGPPRGAAVGALAGVTAHVMPMLLALLWFHVLRGARHQGEAGLGAIGDALGVVIVLGGAAIGAVVGAILGAAITWLRKGY